MKWKQRQRQRQRRRKITSSQLCRCTRANEQSAQTTHEQASCRIFIRPTVGNNRRQRIKNRNGEVTTLSATHTSGWQQAKKTTNATKIALHTFRRCDKNCLPSDRRLVHLGHERHLRPLIITIMCTGDGWSV